MQALQAFDNVIPHPLPVKLLLKIIAHILIEAFFFKLIL